MGLEEERRDEQEEENRSEAGNRSSFPGSSKSREGPAGGVGRDEEWRSILLREGKKGKEVSE